MLSFFVYAMKGNFGIKQAKRNSVKIFLVPKNTPL
jgi:hypothetical protein